MWTSRYIAKPHLSHAQLVERCASGVNPETSIIMDLPKKKQQPRQIYNCGAEDRMSVNLQGGYVFSVFLSFLSLFFLPTIIRRRLLKLHHIETSNQLFAPAGLGVYFKSPYLA